MAVTPAQLATLKAAINADPTLSAFQMTGDGYFDLAVFLNTSIATPDFWIWRESVPKGEYTQGTSVDGTTFNWTGAGFITRSVGERDAWRELFNGTGQLNPALVSVRQALNDIFSGATAPAPANRTHLLAVSRTKATRIQKVFAVASAAPPTPSGALGSVTAVATTSVSSVSPADVEAARNLP